MQSFLDAVKAQASSVLNSIEKIINTNAPTIVPVTEQDKVFLITLRADLIEKKKVLETRILELQLQNGAIESSLNTCEDLVGYVSDIIDDLEETLEE